MATAVGVAEGVGMGVAEAWPIPFRRNLTRTVSVVVVNGERGGAGTQGGSA